MPTKTTKLSMTTNLARHRKQKSQDRNFEQFISQVAVDLKKVVTELAKAQGLLLAFADYLKTIVDKLSDMGAPENVINDLTSFHETVSNMAQNDLPVATDTVADTVNQLQTVINNVMNMNIPEMLESFQK